MRDRDFTSLLQDCWSSEASQGTSGDYDLLAEFQGAFAARSQGGLPAVVIPVSRAEPMSVGRRASGCELLGHTLIRFLHEGREWTGPAAALVCTDADLLDVFAVLAADLVRRVQEDTTWNSILTIVEEWQTLLTPRGVPSPEVESGLWGELWFIDQSRDLARAIAAWRGPEGDSTDFFVDGKAAEVKTSKNRRQHHVSQSQVDAPAGAHEAWLLSIWIKVDPAASVTVPSLVDRILARTPDRANTLKRLARAGFSPSDRRSFTSGFVVLSEPEWYAAPDVPRVRAFDAGVSNLRYRVTLDETLRADASLARRLRLHFLGQE